MLVNLVFNLNSIVEILPEQYFKSNAIFVILQSFAKTTTRGFL